MRLINFTKNKKGYAILLAVLVIGAVSLSITLYLMLSAFNNAKNGFLLEQSNKAKALVNACAETAISKVEACSSTIGNFELAIGEEKCSYNIYQSADQEKNVEAVAQVGEAIRKVKVVVVQTPSSTAVSSWQEVASF